MIKKIVFLVVVLFSWGKLFAENITLKFESRVVDLDGKKVLIKTINNLDGQWGIWAKEGDKLKIKVLNQLNESTVIHWHGLILPNSQDGVAGVTQLFDILPQQSYSYSFPLLQSGTYFMHSHDGLQIQEGVEAPFIILAPEDLNYQQIVVMLQDFSFKKPSQILQDLTHNESSSPMMHDMSGMSNMSDMHDKTNMDIMDLNDVKYDYYLTNYHTPSNPQIIQVKPNTQVKLRFINGSAATNFWINLGSLTGKIVAVDGSKINPLSGRKFQLAIGQRVDIITTIKKPGTYPILGQVEGLTKQTGLILTTESNLVGLKIESENQLVAKELNYNQEYLLKSVNQPKFNAQPVKLKLVLNGNMNSYHWTLNQEMWPKVKPLKIKLGSSVILELDNQSAMAHPIHLHGYQFKVIQINNKKVNGALRDTILVLPKSKVLVEFNANHLGRWVIHCHMAYHMASGMMTYLDVVK